MIKGLCKGEWKMLADNGSQKLWDVIMGDGSTHEVVTATWLDENFIIEVDGEMED
jgi:hypothetical protein